MQLPIVSDASPITFWPIAGQTYNQQIAATGFVENQPWFQEWLCTDFCKLQVTNDPNLANTYSLKILAQDGVTVLDTENFSQTLIQGNQISPVLSLPNFATALTPWTNNTTWGSSGSNAVWAWQSPNVILSNGTSGSFSSSALLYVARPDGYTYGWPPGTYSINFVGRSDATGPDANSLYCGVYGSNNAGVTVTLQGYHSSIATGNFNFTITFTTTQYWVDLGFAFFIGPPTNVTITTINAVNLIAAPANETWGEYDLEFNFNTLSTSVCDQYVQFILDQNGSAWMQSDAHKISSTIYTNPAYGTLLAEYKASKNFADITYPNTTNYFQLRLPARFFHQRFPKESTSLPLSNSQIIGLSTMFKVQQKLSTVYLPPYMLLKLNLILAHCIKGSLSINGDEWISEESVDLVLPDEMAPNQRIETWLTRKDYVVRTTI